MSRCSGRGGPDPLGGFGCFPSVQLEGHLDAVAHGLEDDAAVFGHLHQPHIGDSPAFATEVAVSVTSASSGASTRSARWSVRSALEWAVRVLVLMVCTMAASWFYP